MKEWNSIDDILDFAIGEEEAAAQFYTELAEQMTRQWMKDVFEGFAQEEMGHKAKLLQIKEGKRLMSAQAEIKDLKIGDYLVSMEPSPTMEYQDALIVAMKKEKAAFKLYTDLAAVADDENVRNTFLLLAQEEAKHKLRFELEYDDFVLTEN